MPPRRKDNLRPGGKPKAQARTTESESDFLEAADEFEKAAGKWRAGDPAKATRFFNRAIDAYNTGLSKYPASFDLTYNKANLQYHMSEDRKIASLLGNRLDLLQETLRSHRTALALLPENADILFNTAQVLTSTAEAILDGYPSSSQSTSSEPSAAAFLEEAVQLFTKCLHRQNHEYEEHLKAVETSKEAQLHPETTPENAPESTEENMDVSWAPSEGSAQWATVEELILPEHVLETCVGQLDALATLIGIYEPSDQAKIDVQTALGLETVNSWIPRYVLSFQQSPLSKPVEEPEAGPTLSVSASSSSEEPKTSPAGDALLAAAKFQTSVAECLYRRGQQSELDYAQQIEQIFTRLRSTAADTTQSIPRPVDIDLAYTDAMIELATAISDSPSYDPSSTTSLQSLTTQWNALTQAQSLLTGVASAPSTLPSARLADVFLARGDADLFRLRISLSPSAKSEWVRSKGTLVANAGVFYRGARLHAERAGAADIRQTADAKAIVAEILKEAVRGSGVVNERWKGRGEDVRKVLEGMVDEGLVGKEDAEGVFRYVG